MNNERGDRLAKEFIPDLSLPFLTSADLNRAQHPHSCPTIFTQCSTNTVEINCPCRKNKVRALLSFLYPIVKLDPARVLDAPLSISRNVRWQKQRHRHGPTDWT
jgi:hypothetical protein